MPHSAAMFASFRQLMNAFWASAFIGVSLFCWRIAYGLSDWAALALVPMTLFLYLGCYPLLMEPRRAKLRLSLREDSTLSRRLTGKLWSAVLSVIFVVAATVLLAWQALSASPMNALLLLLMVFVAGSFFAYLETVFNRHFHPPFAKVFSAFVATWLVALPFAGIITFYNWAYEIYPGAMLTASFPEALQMGIDELPARRGLIAEPLSWFFAYDAAKLWLVVQLREYPLAAVIFSLDAAVFGFVLARAGIVLTDLIQSKIQVEHA